MAGEGNKVGEVYVEIKATGAENVAKEVQKAQQMATAHGGFTSMPSWAGNVGANSTMTGGGGPAVIKETTAAIKEHVEAVEKLKPANNGAGDAAKKNAGGLKELSNNIKEAIAPVNALRQGFLQLIGAVAGWGAAFGILVTAGAAFDRWLGETQKKIQEYQKSIAELDLDQRGLAKSTQEMLNDDGYGKGPYEERLQKFQELQTKQKDLNDKFLNDRDDKERLIGTSKEQRDKWRERDFTEFSKQQADDLAKYKEKLDNELKSEQSKAKSEKDQKETAAFNDTVAKRKAAENEAVLAALDGAARINEQGRQEVEALEAEKLKQQDETIREEYDLWIAATKRKYEALGAAQAEADQKKYEADKAAEARELKRIEDAANTQAKAISEAYTKANADIMANFANAQSQSIEELGQYVKLIAEQVGR